MEKPYTDRAILNETIRGFEIVIPAKKNWFVIIFMSAWLGGWLMGEIFALGAVTGLLGFGSSKAAPAGLFLLFWLVAWTAGGFFAIRTWTWLIAGKEIITVQHGQISVEKKGALFSQPKTYDLNEVKKIRVQEDDTGNYWGKRNNIWNLNSGGTIRFDYGLQTIRIAGGIDEAEADYILKKLTEKRLLEEKNFE